MAAMLKSLEALEALRGVPRDLLELWTEYTRCGMRRSYTWTLEYHHSLMAMAVGPSQELFVAWEDQRVWEKEITLFVEVRSLVDGRLLRQWTHITRPWCPPTGSSHLWIAVTNEGHVHILTRFERFIFSPQGGLLHEGLPALTPELPCGPWKGWDLGFFVQIQGQNGMIVVPRSPTGHLVWSYANHDATQIFIVTPEGRYSTWRTTDGLGSITTDGTLIYACNMLSAEEEYLQAYTLQGQLLRQVDATLHGDGVATLEWIEPAACTESVVVTYHRYSSTVMVWE